MMTTKTETKIELQRTSRREARELYARFLLKRAGVGLVDAEKFLTTRQAVLENKSILDLIYSGDYSKAVDIVEQFVDGQLEED